MTPDRIEEIRQRLHNNEAAKYAFSLCEDIEYLLAALATAEAEGRRQGIEAAVKVVDSCRHGAEAVLVMKQVFPEVFPPLLPEEPPC